MKFRLGPIAIGSAAIGLFALEGFAPANIAGLFYAQTEEDISKKFALLGDLVENELAHFAQIERERAAIITDIHNANGFSGKTLDEVTELMGASWPCNATHTRNGEICSEYIVFDFAMRALQLFISDDKVILKTRLVHT